MRGRGPERAAVDGLIADARRGRAGVLEVIGEPGIGKTTLGEYAVATPGLTVLRALGVDGEADLPFAALSELLRPLRAAVGDLPDAQRAATRALFDGTPGSVDRFALAAATLALLAGAAESEPVLVVVDDAHWLDELSASALSFALRRLRADAVAVIICRRAGARRPLAGPWPQLPMLGVATGEAAALIEADAAPGVVAALHAATGGNPLALRELGRILSADQLAGTASLPEPLPLGERGTAAFAWRLAELPEATTRALLVVAAAGPADTGLLAKALDELGCGANEIDTAERAGVLRVEDGVPRFTHPLVRAAAVAAASPAQRRAAHRALAGAGRGGDVQRHAHHLAAAAALPSEEVASALERAARDAEHRGGPAAGAATRVRACDMSPESPLRDERRVSAAHASVLAGRRDDASRMVDEVLGGGHTGGVRQQALAIRASLAVWSAGVVAAVPTLWAAVDELAPDAPDLAALVAIQLVVILGSVGRCADMLAVARRATSLAVTDPLIGHLVAYRHAYAAVMCGDVDPLDDAERRFPLERFRDEAWRRFPLHHQATGQTWYIAERFGQAHRIIADDLRTARSSAAPALLPMALTMSMDLSFLATDLRRARAAGDEAIELGEQVGFDGLIGFTHGLRARIAAAEGDRSTTVRHAQQATAVADATGQRPVEMYSNHALGLLELGAGAPKIAVRHLQANDALARSTGIANPISVPWRADLVEALHGAGRPDEAAAALATLQAEADGTGSRWAESVSLRGRALLGGGPGDPGGGWAELFRQALAGQDQLPFEHARTALLFGARLRRDRRVTEAREQLVTAVEGFDRFGAETWSRRARAELRAAGVRLRPTVSVRDLTGQELRVCLAVADGATNKEAAAALFLSPKTVEHHLSRAFAKLGVSTRSQLARLAATGSLHGAG